MLTIRQQQMQALKQAALRSFEDEMVQNLNKFAPRHCEVIGEDGVREVIRLGIDRAKNYGLTNRGPVRFYIELMFMFGSYFDTDPQMLWASTILKNKKIDNQTDRADQLYEKTMDYLKKVAGPENLYSIRALRSIRKKVDQPPVLSNQLFDNVMLREMKSLYTQKYTYVGESSLRILIKEGMKLSKTYSIQTMHGMALFVVLMFAMGHGFATDPLFPWISKTLNDIAISDPNKRVQQLEAKAMAYLGRALAYLEKR